MAKATYTRTYWAGHFLNQTLIYALERWKHIIFFCRTRYLQLELSFQYKVALLRQHGTPFSDPLSIFSNFERGTSYTVNDHPGWGTKPKCPKCRQRSLSFPGSPDFSIFSILWMVFCLSYTKCALSLRLASYHLPKLFTGVNTVDTTYLTYLTI